MHVHALQTPATSGHPAGRSPVEGSPAEAAAVPVAVTGARGNRGWDADGTLEDTYAAHWHSLVRLAVLLVGDQGTAEELVQDSFVAMHGRWGRLRDPDRALAYLRQTVVNRCRSALRHRRVVERRLRSTASVDAHQPGADEGVLVADRRRAVRDAVRTLPRRQREVVALRYYLGLSEAEIAAALGISRGAVKSHASRGATALRAALAEARLDDPHPGADPGSDRP